jgi:hypothetical protein
VNCCWVGSVVVVVVVVVRVVVVRVRECQLGWIDVAVCKRMEVWSGTKRRRKEKVT